MPNTYARSAMVAYALRAPDYITGDDDVVSLMVCSDTHTQRWPCWRRCYRGVKKVRAHWRYIACARTARDGRACAIWMSKKVAEIVYRGRCLAWHLGSKWIHSKLVHYTRWPHTNTLKYIRTYTYTHVHIHWSRVVSIGYDQPESSRKLSQHHQ